jgi:hypothetical protein
MISVTPIRVQTGFIRRESLDWLAVQPALNRAAKSVSSFLSGTRYRRIPVAASTWPTHMIVGLARFQLNADTEAWMRRTPSDIPTYLAERERMRLAGVPEG